MGNDDKKKQATTEKPSLKKMLFEHYTQAPETIFPRFKLGAVIFLIGLIIIYAGSQLLKPSLSQEIITFIGLLVIGFGFLMAMMVQIRMLIGRILRFFFDD